MLDRDAAASGYVRQPSRIAAAFASHHDHGLGLRRKRPRLFLTPAGRVADGVENGQAVASRQPYLDGFKFLSFLRGLRGEDYRILVGEGLFLLQFPQAAEDMARPVGVGDEPPYFRMLGLTEEVK